jgi:hypothetical protein
MPNKLPLHGPAVGEPRERIGHGRREKRPLGLLALLDLEHQLRV